MSPTSGNWCGAGDGETNLGSKTLNNIIAKYEKQIFLNIHGHSHEGDGFKRFGGCVVYNPGSLGKHDQFGRITLKRDQIGKWAAKGFEFMTVEDITLD